jgi:hypothetical protein
MISRAPCLSTLIAVLETLTGNGGFDVVPETCACLWL